MNNSTTTSERESTPVAIDLSSNMAAFWAKIRHECQLSCAELAHKIAVSDLVLTQTENRVAADVAAEVTEDGKPAFSSEDKRKLEVALRLEDNEHYVNERSRLLADKLALGQRKADADYHHDMTRIVVAFNSERRDG